MRVPPAHRVAVAVPADGSDDRAVGGRDDVLSPALLAGDDDGAVAAGGQAAVDAVSQQGASAGPGDPVEHQLVVVPARPGGGEDSGAVRVEHRAVEQLHRQLGDGAGRDVDADDWFAVVLDRGDQGRLPVHRPVQKGEAAVLPGDPALVDGSALPGGRAQHQPLGFFGSFVAPVIPGARPVVDHREVGAGRHRPVTRTRTRAEPVPVRPPPKGRAGASSAVARTRGEIGASCSRERRAARMVVVSRARPAAGRRTTPLGRIGVLGLGQKNPRSPSPWSAGPRGGAGGGPTG